MKCEAETEIWTRVCGFFRPLKQWNKGKRAEFVDRRVYVIEEGQLEKAKPQGSQEGGEATEGLLGANGFSLNWSDQSSPKKVPRPEGSSQGQNHLFNSSFP